MPKTPITVAHGDGIGPEIMRATLRILKLQARKLKSEVIEVGEKIYLQGNTTGLGADAWESIRRTKVFLKAPITTPQGGGYKSLNVTIRKTLVFMQTFDLAFRTIPSLIQSILKWISLSCEKMKKTYMLE